ncbi:hypothetical protein MTP99_006992 [Tenebrio molitor]|nr:hypothetical protein MTP99_006992 [Tenebrio molitor]
MAHRVGDLAYLYRAAQIFGQQFNGKSTEQGLLYGIILTNFSSFFMTLGTPVGVIWMCDSILRRVEECIQLSKELRWQLRKSEDREMINYMSSFLMELRPNFSAARFFDIDKLTILSILWTTTTFFIILVQFEIHGGG